MEKKTILENLKLGNTVAEYDENLIEYFVKTKYVDEFLSDKYDIIVGGKGSGKTAMLIALTDNCNDYEKLQGIKLIKAINIKGDPDYKRAFDSVKEKLDSQEIIDSWKIYVINLIWKHIYETCQGYNELEKYLKDNNIVAEEKGFLNKLIHAFKVVKSLTAYNKFNPDGSIEQGLSTELRDEINFSNKRNNLIDFNYIFSELDKILLINNTKVWIMMDRLDDAFPDNTETSKNILKNLLVAYKDICVYKNFKFKIFIRDDIFSVVTTLKGFTSLTHVATKTMPSIIWDREKLEELLLQRLLFNKVFRLYMEENNINYESINSDDRANIFKLLFKEQVDVGKRNPDTIGWIINHIKDGNGLATPRDFVSIIEAAIHYQLNDVKINEDSFLIGAAALRKSYASVSKLKVETQLYAEYPECRVWIEKFKNKKAEYDETTLQQILGKQWKYRTGKLKAIGFIEEKQNTWKIPFIYREYLNITQGKA